MHGRIYGFKHCHCRTCRKIHGTVYGSSALTDAEGFRVTQGEPDIERYASSPGKRRCFCRHCGSHVFAYYENDPSFVVLRLGTLDSAPAIAAEAHIWVSHKAPWYQILDEIPKYAEDLPGASKVEDILKDSAGSGGNAMQATLEGQQVTVRPATPNEVKLVLSFIRKKAAFDRNIGSFSGTLHTSEEKIHKTIFDPKPVAYFLVAEMAGQPVGFALYYFRYSSFAGQPSIWLDDLYVGEDMRSRGAGAALMRVLAQIARDTSCTHIAWTADARNTRGLKFYRRLEATITEQKGNVCFLMWTPQAEAV
jgi:GNAT superfamily N-acetyltransferase